jgi:hypothetical protein
MLQLWVKIRLECPLRRPINHAPYGASAIAVFRVWTKWIAGLETEVRLDAVDGGEVVVFDFAELEEARARGVRVCVFSFIF